MFQKNENKKGNLVTLTGADLEIIANFTSEMLFNEKGNTLERFINEVNSEDRNAISQFIHDFISWLKARLKGEKVSFKIIRLENRFAAVLRSVDNTNAQKNNTTNDGDVKLQARELQRKDPTKLKEEELTTLLGYTKDKMLADDTYIPMRVNTPKIIIAFAKEFGYELENHPLAMQVYKARQALSNEENWDGSYKDKPHDLSSEEIIGIIRAMDNPSHLIFQTENERFAEIVKFEKERLIARKLRRQYALAFKRFTFLRG